MKMHWFEIPCKFEDVALGLYKDTTASINLFALDTAIDWEINGWDCTLVTTKSGNEIIYPNKLSEWIKVLNAEILKFNGSRP